MKDMAELAGMVLDEFEAPDAKTSKRDLHLQKEFRERTKLEEIKMNKKRFEKIQTLGKGLTGGNIELSRSA